MRAVLSIKLEVRSVERGTRGCSARVRTQGFVFSFLFGFVRLEDPGYGIYDSNYGYHTSCCFLLTPPPPLLLLTYEVPSWEP